MTRAVSRVCARFGVPLTAKLRTGVFDKRLLTHTLLPRLRDAGLALATVRRTPCFPTPASASARARLSFVSFRFVQTFNTLMFLFFSFYRCC